MARILIIDDDVFIQEVIEENAAKLGHEPFIAKNLTDGMVLSEAHPFDLVFLDVRLPDGDGLESLPGIQANSGEPQVIIITGAGDAEGAELAINNGAWDYLQKPFSRQNIRLQIQRVVEYRSKKTGKNRIISLKRDDIIGTSPQLNACLDRIAQCADSDASVLITGETGTGKELFARAIHENSRRFEKPFVVVDCASLPDQLVESLLFGHEKGAFTGAHTSQTGLISEADGGTLFLDEVGELPLLVQKNFLRVLQEGRFRPVGNRKEITSNFRLIAATNRNIEGMVKSGTFREDLLYRLRGFVVGLPSLRDRKEDIKALILHYIFITCKNNGLKIKGMTPEFLETLDSYDWPGNIRELITTIQEAVLADPGNPVLFPMHLPPQVRVHHARRSLEQKKGIPLQVQSEALPLHPAYPRHPACMSVHPNEGGPFPPPSSQLGSLKAYRDDLIEKGEHCYLEQLLALTGNDIAKACGISELSKSRLYYLLKKYNISLK